MPFDLCKTLKPNRVISITSLEHLDKTGKSYRVNAKSREEGVRRTASGLCLAPELWETVQHGEAEDL
jgi:hypothetical protein